MTAITRESGSAGMIIQISPRGEGPFTGKNTHECGVLQDLLMISIAAVSEYSVCGTPKFEKMFKLS